MNRDNLKLNRVRTCLFEAFGSTFFCVNVNNACSNLLPELKMGFSLELAWGLLHFPLRLAME